MKSNLIFSVIIALTFASNAFALEVKFADEKWDGLTIPKGQQCQKFGGKSPSTPIWMVSDIPPGSDTIVFEYSDRDSQRMNNGGHGKMQFKIDPGAKMATVPSVPGHTFEMPQGFTMLDAHRGPNWDKAGAYMPPCSGGKGHAYYVTITTMNADRVTAQTVVEMGKY